MPVGQYTNAGAHARAACMSRKFKDALCTALAGMIQSCALQDAAADERLAHASPRGTGPPERRRQRHAEVQSCRDQRVSPCPCTLQPRPNSSLVICKDEWKAGLALEIGCRLTRLTASGMTARCSHAELQWKGGCCDTHGCSHIMYCADCSRRPGAQMGCEGAARH